MAQPAIAALPDVADVNLQGQLHIAPAVATLVGCTRADYIAAKVEQHEREALKRLHPDNVTDREVSAGVSRKQKVKYATIGKPCEPSLHMLADQLAEIKEGQAEIKELVKTTAGTMVQHARAVHFNARAMAAQSGNQNLALVPVPQLAHDAPPPALAFGDCPQQGAGLRFPVDTQAARTMSGAQLDSMAALYGPTSGILPGANVAVKPNAFLDFIQGL